MRKSRQYNNHAAFGAANAIAAWMSVVDYVGPEFEIYAESVTRKLEQLAPNGWLPSDINDPVLQKAFELMR